MRTSLVLEVSCTMFLPPPARCQYSNPVSVMVWLEGGQGEVRGACDGPTLGLVGMYPPNRPTRTPPNQPTLTDSPRGKSPPDPPPPPSPLPEPPLPSSPPKPPPLGASGQQLVGGVVGVQNRGVAPPPPPHPRALRTTNHNEAAKQ